MAFLTVAEFLTRYDPQRVGDLATQAGTRVAAASLPANAVVLAAVADAEEDVVSACLVGKRYTRSDLIAVAAGSGGPRLKRLVSQLAYGYLHEHKGYPQSEAERLAPGYARALQELELLRQGERVLDVGDDDIPDAGLPETEPVASSITLPGDLNCQLRRFLGTASQGRCDC